MASFGRSGLASRVPGTAAASRAAVGQALAQSWADLRRVAWAAVSPARWWARLTSVVGVAVLLGLSVLVLVAGLVVTWPHR
jgi:hypothetical protein